MLKPGDRVRVNCHCSGMCNELTNSRQLFIVIREQAGFWLKKYPGGGAQYCYDEKNLLPDVFLNATLHAIQAASEPALQDVSPARAKGVDSK